MKIREIVQKDGILIRKINGKIYAGGALAWVALAMKMYEDFRR